MTYISNNTDVLGFLNKVDHCLKKIPDSKTSQSLSRQDVFIVKLKRGIKSLFDMQSKQRQIIEGNKEQTETIPEADKLETDIHQKISRIITDSLDLQQCNFGYEIYETQNVKELIKTAYELNKVFTEYSNNMQISTVNDVNDHSSNGNDVDDLQNDLEAMHINPYCYNNFGDDSVKRRGSGSSYRDREEKKIKREGGPSLE